MRTRIFASAVAVFALVLGVVIATPATSAQALTAGVSFSADNLATWQTNGVVRAVAASQGRVVAVGEFTQIRPGAGMSGSAQNVTGVAIFEADTGAPSSCQLPATLSGGTARLYTAEASPDGSTVFVGGNFNSIGGVSRTRIAEINVQTCTVTSFNVSGLSSFVYSLEVTSNAVYFGGLFQTVAGQPRRSFAKVNRAGVLDPNWVADAVGNMETRPEPGIECRTTADANSRGLAIAASPDGSKIALGGSFYTVNGTNTHSIAIVDAETGAVTRSYPANPLNWGDGNNFIHPCSITKAIVSDGTSFYIGNEGSGGGVFDGAARLSWATGDQDWRDRCLGAVQALAVENGKLFQAHHHHDCSSQGLYPDGRRIYLSVTDVTDPQQKQLGWFPTLNDGTGEGIGGRGLAVATKNGQKYLWVSGEFTSVNGGAQQGLTRFGTTDTGNPPTPSINVRAVTPGALQITARSVYDPDDAPLQYILFRNNVQLGDPVSVSTSWWTRPQVTFVDSTATPGVSYSYRVRAVDAAGNQSALSAAQNGVASATASSYAATIVGDQPDLYWRYDDSGAWVIDRSGKVGSAKNGIAQNGVTYAAGAIPGDGSSSAVFDGASQYIWNDQIAYGPSTYTIETWFKTASTTGGSIVSYGNGRPRTDNGNDTASGSYDRIVYMENGTGRIRFGIYNGSVRTLRSDLAYNDDQWHHVVATQSSAGMRLYIDGAEVGRNNVTTAQEYYGTWRVGGDNLNSWPESGNGSTASRFYDGQIDETAIYSTALSQNKAIDHFLAGGGEMDLNEAPADAYGAAVFGDNPTSYWRFDEASGSVAEDSSFLGARDGVIGSGVTRFTAGTKIPGGAVTTPGTNSNGSGLIRTGLVAAPSEYSIEFWVNTTTTSGGKIVGFENSPTESGNSYDKQVYMLNDGRLRFGIYNGAVQSVTTTSALNNGQWHHVVATQGSQGMRIYVDGALQGSNGVTNSETGDGYWRFGGGNLGGWPDASSSHYFAGKLDEAAIYPAALTSDAVVNHYAIALQDSTAPTVPTNVTHTGTTSAQLSWSASADANGVSGYRIYRGSSAGFAIEPSALVGDVTTTSWTDPNTTPGTRYYKVTAYDIAGNESSSGSAVQVVLADVTAPTTVSGLAASVAGVDVALTWNASSDDVAVDHYAVYRSLTPGFAIADGTLIAEPSTASYTDVAVGEGQWYYRVVALDAAGNVSGASAAVGALVDIDTDAPSTPTDLAGTAAADGTVSLGWTASTDDVGVVGYRVYRGTTAGFTADADSLVADGVTGTTWTDTATTVGTRHYKVAAYDLAGNVSAASASASVTVADTENPTVPTGLTVTATGSDATLQWTAATDNIEVDRYAVYRGTSAGFSITGLTPIAQPTGTTYTDEDLADGQYFYRVVAIDGAGNRSAATGSQGVTIDTSEPVEPVTLTANVQADTMVAQSAANTVYGTSNQISARGGSTGQIESYLRFAIPDAPAGTTLTGATLRLTTSTDSTANSTGTHQVSILTGSWAEATTTWNNRPTTGFGATIGQLTGATALNTTYTVTLDAAALASLTGSDVSLALRTTTSTDNVRLVSKEGTGTTRRPVLVLEYTPGTTPEPEPDTAAPSVPAGLEGTGTAAGAVSLSWTASTDNVGVTGYRVYRGTTAGFTANGSSQVGTPTGTSFSQTGVAEGTWYYRVAAVDAAGNVSAASASASVVVPPAPEEPLEPVTTSVVALKDAMVAQSSTGTNYGAANYLSARGGTTGALQSYLAFELPATPEGRVLTSAVLRLRTTSDSTSGSADTHDVRLVASDWTEASLTWANRPTTIGATVGSITGLTAVNTTYERPLTASTLAPLGGTTVGFLVTDNGTDNLRFWSKESTTASYRPTLVLTYTAAP